VTLLGNATLPSESADPRRTQKRVANTPSGRQVFVDISGEDRRRLIKTLPGRWPEVVMARERGETLEQISRWAKVPPPCEYGCRFVDLATRDGDKWEDAPADRVNLVTERVHVGPECLAFILGYIYAWLETELHDMAARRARVMV